jgi:hypothetical protein
MHDPYLNDEACIERLVAEYRRHGSIAIAYDFDDTVYDFHKKGRSYPALIALLREARAAGCHLIVWTGNEDRDFVERYLRDENIPYDAINEHPPFYQSGARKVYANLYLDDRAGLSAAFYHLEQMLATIAKDKEIPDVAAN